MVRHTATLEVGPALPRIFFVSRRIGAEGCVGCVCDEGVSTPQSLRPANRVNKKRKEKQFVSNFVIADPRHNFIIFFFF